METERPYWPRTDDAEEPAPDGATWPECGHPRTLANSQRVGKAGVRCRICRRKITRDYCRRKRGYQGAPWPA